MTATVREQCLQALATRLAAIAITGLAVVRNPDARLTSFPSLAMIEGEDSRLSYLSGAELRQQRVDLEGLVQSADPTGDLDALYAAIVTALNGDITLGGLCIDIEPDTDSRQVDPAKGHAKAGALLLGLSITYATAIGDPLTRAAI